MHATQRVIKLIAEYKRDFCDWPSQEGLLQSVASCKDDYDVIIGDNDETEALVSVIEALLETGRLEQHTPSRIIAGMRAYGTTTYQLVLPEHARKTWYEDRANLAECCRWLADNGFDEGQVAYCVEKPWKFEGEYATCLALAGRLV